MAISIRQLDYSEWRKGQDFIDALWQKNHILARNPDLFKWQFKSQDAPEKLNFFIAEDENQPVGCIGRIDLPCHRYGQRFSGAAMTNLISLPQYRKFGLGMKIMHASYAGRNYVASIGINERVAKLYRLLGQYIVNPLPRYTCIGNRDALASVIPYIKNAESLTPDSFVECGSLHTTSCFSGKIREINKLSIHWETSLDEWDQCWNKYFAPHLQGVVKNSEYLRWRYLEHPVFHYDILLVLNSENDVKGLAVMRKAELPGGTCALRILEFMSACESTGIRLASAIAERTPANAAFVEHIALGCQWYPLQHIGMTGKGSNLFSVYFNPPDYSHSCVVAAFHLEGMDESPESFICSQNTYITIADCDQDRPN